MVEENTFTGIPVFKSTRALIQAKAQKNQTYDQYIIELIDKVEYYDKLNRLTCIDYETSRNCNIKQELFVQLLKEAIRETEFGYRLNIWRFKHLIETFTSHDHATNPNENIKNHIKTYLKSINKIIKAYDTEKPIILQPIDMNTLKWELIEW